MSSLLTAPPYSPRDPARFLAEMNELCLWHLNGCPDYCRVWPGWDGAERVEDLPYLHAGAFKTRLWKTAGEGITYGRTLRSSATSSNTASMIALDHRSSALQGQSSYSILKDFIGEESRPVLVLDDAMSLRQRGETSARITAAMSLRPWAKEIAFLLRGGEILGSVCWEKVADVLSRHRFVLVYGFTWILWECWARASIPAAVREMLARTKVDFVHSGGWKKLEALSISRQQFDGALLETVGPGSQVVNYYGLVEQVGLVFPLCAAGWRHIPRWADVIVRDPWTLGPTKGVGLLQFLNVLSWGAPYHSVLTEDLGRLEDGPCPCARLGPRFELVGRIPKSETRGCANV